MTAIAEPTPAAQVAERARPATIGGLGFDWLMAGLSVIFLGGLYLDGWAHNHGRVDQSFFTPWHAFFYSGFALTALALLAAGAINWRRGYKGRSALPAGYGLALLGAAIFAAGGVGDLIWHMLFGIEEDFEALVSPTHLLLGAGLALVVSAPMRAAWQRPGGRGWGQLGPALVSLCLLTGAFTFFMMFSHPLFSILGGARHNHFNNDVGQMGSIVSLMLMSGLLLGPLFVALRRWQLPAGVLILVWGVNCVAMAILDWGLPYHAALTGVMVVAVVICDWLLGRAQGLLPSQQGIRVFAFVAPALLFGAYFFALLLTEGSRWSIHLIGGAILLPGLAGWLLSYVAWPPSIPTPDTTDV
jgi:hypothetical protein